jgi:hypothetical protein
VCPFPRICFKTFGRLYALSGNCHAPFFRILLDEHKKLMNDHKKLRADHDQLEKHVEKFTSALDAWSKSHAAKVNALASILTEKWDLTEANLRKAQADASHRIQTTGQPSANLSDLAKNLKARL